MADFANFELADLRTNGGVYNLADGLIPEMAEVFGVDIDEQPSVEALGTLIDVIGKSKVLRENVAEVQEKLGTDGDGLTIAADWTDRSGVQKALDRSLWHPWIKTPRYVHGVVQTGAVANWQDRTTNLLVERAGNGIDLPPIYIPVGTRVMESVTEKVNPNVQAFLEANNERYPTETEYAEAVVAPKLTDAGYEVQVEPYDTQSGSEIATTFVNSHPELFSMNKQVTFARVANAGLMLAVQFRQAARARNTSIQYDAEPHAPQVFVLTDSFPIARTEEEAKDAPHFQNPLTAIRQVAVSAKVLHEAATA